MSTSPGEHEPNEEQHLSDTGLETPASQPVEAVTAEQLPPEAQGETNGGPLGCCLGSTIGLLLSLSVIILSRLYYQPLVSLFAGNLSLAVGIVTASTAIVGAIILGIVGWKIGKRLYKEYELSPRQKRRLAELERKYQRKEKHL